MLRDIAKIQFLQSEYIFMSLAIRFLEYLNFIKVDLIFVIMCNYNYIWFYVIELQEFFTIKNFSLRNSI